VSLELTSEMERNDHMIKKMFLELSKKDQYGTIDSKNLSHILQLP
jgi:hypothetical protein